MVKCWPSQQKHTKHGSFHPRVLLNSLVAEWVTAISKVSDIRLWCAYQHALAAKCHQEGLFPLTREFNCILICKYKDRECNGHTSQPHFKQQFAFPQLFPYDNVNWWRCWLSAELVLLFFLFFLGDAFDNFPSQQRAFTFQLSQLVIWSLWRRVSGDRVLLVHPSDCLFRRPDCPQPPPRMTFLTDEFHHCSFIRMPAYRYNIHGEMVASVCLLFFFFFKLKVANEVLHYWG